MNDSIQHAPESVANPNVAPALAPIVGEAYALWRALRLEAVRGNGT